MSGSRPKNEVALLQPFEDWTVIGEAPLSPAGWGRQWLCRCVCGAERVVLQAALVTGRSRSCGCSRATHGEATKPTAEYRAWKAMSSRCRNPKDPHYPNYGGRGIAVCARWFEYPNFLDDVGRRPGPGYSLDRYPNNNGNYEPGNVRWATAEEQSRNKRNNLLLTIGDVTKAIHEWSEEGGVPAERIRSRLNGRRGRKWSPHEAVFTPVRSAQRGL